MKGTTMYKPSCVGKKGIRILYPTDEEKPGSPRVETVKFRGANK